MEIVIKKSTNSNKKFDAVIDGKKKISFGQAGASDYTKHKDDDRKKSYIDRHRKNENWGKDGVETAGFWATNLLWNKKTLKDSVDDINKRFKSLNVKIKK